MIKRPKLSPPTPVKGEERSSAPKLLEDIRRLQQEKLLTRQDRFLEAFEKGAEQVTSQAEKDREKEIEKELDVKEEEWKEKFSQWYLLGAQLYEEYWPEKYAAQGQEIAKAFNKG